VVRNEPQVWSLMLVGVAIVATSALAGVVVGAVVRASGGAAGIGQLVFSVGCLLACGPISRV
jgi:hypothetical protein